MADGDEGTRAMEESARLVDQFETHRAHLRAVAYRMLGSTGEADDAVQEAWLKVCRSGTAGVENLGGWLTTIVSRVCLDMLRSRRSRREAPLEEPDVRMPDPIVGRADRIDPEQEALLGDSVGLALLVVLESLSPAERLAFVLHDMFGVPFGEIGPIVGRSPTAARQLASRARRRVRGTTVVPDPDLARQRQVVEAFLAASREGDFEALLAVLDEDVVLRADYGDAGASRLIRGARAVAGGALAFSRFAPFARPALVNGAAGLVTVGEGRPISVMGFTIVRGKIAEIDVLADPERLQRLDLA
jgi:RNA polymerase sigma factor (sigma-70 family)